MVSRRIMQLVAAAVLNPDTAFDAAPYRMDDVLMTEVALCDGRLWAAMERKLRREAIVPVFRSDGVTCMCCSLCNLLTHFAYS